MVDFENLHPSHRHRRRCWESRPYPNTSLPETIAEGSSGPGAMEKEREKGRPIGRRSKRELPLERGRSGWRT
jgi:hypothetical protein